MITELTSANFDTFVKGTDKPVLIDFWAPWCGPCRMLSPLVDSLAGERADIAVGKVNVDEAPDLAMRFGVQGIPTLLLFKNGEKVNQSVGLIPAAALQEFVDSAK